MDQENQLNVDINSADEETLTRLQGVGARLAERIIEARPFASITDLTRVRGISDKDVERLRPFLSISEAPDEPDVVDEKIVGEEIADIAEGEVSEDIIEDTATEVEPAFDEATEATIEDAEESGEPEEGAEVDGGPVEPIAEIEADAEAEFADVDEETELVEFEEEAEAESIPEELEPVEEVSAQKPAPQPELITRGGACGLIFIGGLLTLILAVAITLGVLASINNGQLSYASPYQIAGLRSQTESLSVQADTLAEDIAGMRTRIDNLEALNGRVSDVETEVESMQDDVAGLQAEVASTQAQFDELAAQIEGIDEQIETLTVQSDRFEGFLEGLRTLMEGLFPESIEVEE